MKSGSPAWDATSCRLFLPLAKVLSRRLCFLGCLLFSFQELLWKIRILTNRKFDERGFLSGAGKVVGPAPRAGRRIVVGLPEVVSVDVLIKGLSVGRQADSDQRRDVDFI